MESAQNVSWCVDSMVWRQARGGRCWSALRRRRGICLVAAAEELSRQLRVLHRDDNAGLLDAADRAARFSSHSRRCRRKPDTILPVRSYLSKRYCAGQSRLRLGLRGLGRSHPGKTHAASIDPFNGLDSFAIRLMKTLSSLMISLRSATASARSFSVSDGMVLC